MNEKLLIKYPAKLGRETGSLDAEAGFASKHSLYIKILNNSVIPFNEKFENIIIYANNKEYTFNECVFTSIDSHSTYNGILAFTNELYDFTKFFNTFKTGVLENYFYNLPLILSQRNRIQDSFKKFTSDVLYDINVYKTYFDGLDKDINKENDFIYNISANAVIETEGRKFLSFFDETLDELKKQTEPFSKEENERHGFYFRKQAWDLILHSKFLARTNIKPRGYQGDSEMMRQVYTNDYEGDSIFGKLLHKHPIETPAAQAVRNRRNYIPLVLNDMQSQFKHLPEHGFKIMSVACGPAWEMQDLFENSENFEKFNLTLLDQDSSALGEAARAILQVEKKRNVSAKVEYLNESVRTMLRTRKLSEKWGKYHFVYSMGLFDYLTGPVAKAVIGKIYEMLEPGGSLIIGNYHVDNPTKNYMDYWMDWVLYYRTEEEMLNLLPDVPGTSKEVSFDDSNSQIFLKVIKKE